MNSLNQFIKFDFESFAKDKVLVVTNVKEYVDYNTKQHLGTDLRVSIVKDNTVYKCKPDQMITNVYESFSLKVNKDVDVPIGARVIPVNAEATVYGEMRNQLSVKCSDVQIVDAKEK